MPIVQLPDGTHVELPETGPSVLETAAAKAKQVGSSLAAGFGKGVGGLMGLANMIPSAAGKDTKARNAEMADTVMQYWNQVGEKGLPPGYGRAMTEGAGGALMLPGIGGVGSAARQVGAQLLSGAGGGLGQHAAEQLAPNSAIAQLLGSFLGGYGGGKAVELTSRVATPNVLKLTEQALEGINPGDLNKAQAFMQEAKAKGMTVDLAQAMEAIGAPPSNITAIRDYLANSRYGDKTQKVLRDQPRELELQAELTAAKIPGNAYSMQTAANIAQEASTKTVQNAKNVRSAAVKDLYAAAGDLPNDVRTNFANTLMDARTAPGVTSTTVAAIDKALAKLKEAPSTGASMKHALDYDTLINELVGPYKGTPLSPADPKTLGQLKNLAGKLNTELKGASPELKAAEDTFAQISADVIDPLKQSPVGQMATKKGYAPDTQASEAKLHALFAAGTDPKANGTSAILSFAKDLNKTDPEAFPSAAKSWISTKLAEATPATIKGGTTTDPAISTNIWNTFFKTEKQWQGMRDMAAGIADAYGVPRQDVVRGLENLAQLTKAAKARPGQVSGVSPEDITSISKSSNVANASRVFGFLPFERVARGVEGVVLGRTLSRFDELLTTPEGVDTLTKLGKKSIMSPDMAAILRGFVGGEGAERNPAGVMPQ